MDRTSAFLHTWTFPSSQMCVTVQETIGLATNAATPDCRLLKLPIELRMMIWDLLLPDLKVLLAKVRDVTTNEDWENGKTNRVQFYLEDHSGKSKPHVPLLSSICQDSRAFLFDHGGFAFGKAEEGGIWWNAKADTLVIDSTWDDVDFVTQFDGMSGLEHVKNLALDTNHAGDLAYRVTYSAGDTSMPREQRQPLAVDITFRSYLRGCGSTDHFIPRLFTGLEHIMLYFPELNEPDCCRPARRHSYSAEAGCRAHPTKLISDQAISRKVDITLKLKGEAGMTAAAESMRQCRQLWMAVDKLDLLLPFHQGGGFYYTHPWQQGCQFHKERPSGAKRYLITCEEMMEDCFLAL